MNDSSIDPVSAESKGRNFAAATDYIKRGWAVFPLHMPDEHGQCSCGLRECLDVGKHPRVARGFKEATRDPAKIELWFGPDAPPSNIGIATGAISGITVIDVDTGAEKQGAATWAELIQDHGEPDTLMARTGGGGTHIVFKYNSALKTGSNVLGTHVDVRGDGGYICAPPSRHRSGGVYEWLNPGTSLADLPAHLSKRKETRGRPRKDDPRRKTYSLEEVASMLDVVPSDDRDMWRHIGIILGREFNRSDEAWELYLTWAEKAGSKKGRNHEAIQREAFYELSQQESDKQLSIATVVKAATCNGWAPKTGEVPIALFICYGPSGTFIYRPTGSQWPSSSVDAAVSPVNVDGKIISASEWLRKNRMATSMTSDPQFDEDFIPGVDCDNGSIVEVEGAALFNAYRKPTVERGDATLAAPWVDHAHRIFNKQGDADQALDYLAHLVQFPGLKLRFALLIGGCQGNGKDTLIEMACPAIGVHNVSNIEPPAFDSGFNEYVASTLVRINEAASVQAMMKWLFNERTKVLIAGTPDQCIVNPKYGQKYSLRLHGGVIITTNNLLEGIYLPPDDRRYDVIETATFAEMGLEDVDCRRKYFDELWNWFLNARGRNHVAAYLHERDLSRFNPNNGQRKTAAHRAIIERSNSADEWLQDVLDDLPEHTGVRGDLIVTKAVAAGEDEHAVKRKLSDAIGRLGYVTFRNPNEKRGRWRIGEKKVTVFVKAGTPVTFDPTTALGKEPF